MKKEKWEKVDQFDEIIFEHRNKAYGAYVIRKSYNRTLAKALGIALLLLLFAVGTPFLMANLNPAPLEIIEDTQIDLMGIIDDTEDPIELPKEELPKDPEVEKPPVFAEIIVDENASDTTSFRTTDQWMETTITQPVDEPEQQIVDLPKVISAPEKVLPPYAVHEMPEFPGGDMEMKKFFATNTDYPDEAVQNDVQGVVYVEFVVDKDGKISDAVILRSLHPALDKEALRIINLFPGWIPGKVNGNPVSVRMSLPVRFKLE